MRRYLKKQCLATIDVLCEAHTEIEKLISQGEMTTCIDLLGQCQQGAITVGDTIESSEGEGTDEVHQLETYCEMVYQLSEDINTGKSVNARKAVKNLDKPLVIVANGIRSRIPTEKEVVFLPYKASMWDSLESVWIEMKNDSSVNAIVVPIPYFDKNPDGSVRAMHYEGAEFPEDVPVVDYRSYNIKERHPDAIYVHNPYDEANHITTIHPDYYSSRIYELTDELVYIPYFILGDVDPENKVALEGSRHLIITNVMKYAHRVIVWSEDWRKAFINVMSDFVGEDTREYWEKIIEVQESSKLKRVRNLKESDYAMPSDWIEKSTKPDGSKKKIIFYNTGVDPLLKESDKMVDKIERVLQIFKENVDDITLLWRPHPLVEATLTSMRPELWERYKKIVETYKSEDWGIYDDTAELERAIAVSDAYFGDQSSVVWMYKETGKPIMIQNCEV